jgi:drug/metabolite transporter (DMT)-like permease
MTPLIPAVSGALIVAGVIGLIAGLRRVPVTDRVPTRSRSLNRLRSLPRQTRLLLAAGFMAGVLGWLVYVTCFHFIPLSNPLATLMSTVGMLILIDEVIGHPSDVTQPVGAKAK